MKLGPVALFVLGAVASACGYHAAYGGEEPAYRLTVGATALRSPHPEALEAALAGARAELGRSGALEAGSGYPRLVVELVRVDEVASGIAASDSPSGRLPLARGSAVGVTARAWVEEREGAAPVRETGDVRRVEAVGQGSDVLAGSTAFLEASRAAGRAVGEALARRALGIAEPSVEPM